MTKLHMWLDKVLNRFSDWLKAQELTNEQAAVLQAMEAAHWTSFQMLVDEWNRLENERLSLKRKKHATSIH